jgi:formamidopyrimidine-DNA glycosylase
VVTGPEDPAGGWSRAPADRRDAPKPRVDKRLLLEGSAIEEIGRRGKQLAIFGDRAATGIHLGMTGQLLFRAPGERLRKSDHVHVTWRLVTPGGAAVGRLVFRDPRRFGSVSAHESREELVQTRWDALGPDALTLSASTLIERLRPRRSTSGPVRNVKSALLDQATLAGVGNIYADESLFRAGIRPGRRVDRLTDNEIALLACSILEVLQEAVASGGSTLRDYVDGEGSSGSFQFSHRVYGRTGQMCITCGETLVGDVVAQRTTVWCPRCQG